jgi:hypothetical protein
MTMQYSMVIDPGETAAQLVGAVDRALTAAEADGLRPFRYAYTETDASECDIHLWLGVDKGEEVKAVEDPHMAAVYLLYQGPEAEALEPYFVRLLGTLTAPDLLATLPDMLEKHPDRLMALTLCDSGRFDPASAAFIEECLKDSRTEVRLAAANGAALAKWPQLADAVAAALAAETDEDVERTLRYAQSAIG